jgi:hypothetical protein
MKVKINKKIKKQIKKLLSQPELTCRTRNSGHETEITSHKESLKKYETQFSTNPMLKDEIKKINIFLKNNNLSQLMPTCDPDHETRITS